MAKKHNTKQEQDVGINHYEIAKRLGISRQRVGYLERQALKKIKKILDSRGLTFEDFRDMIKGANDERRY